MPGELRSLHGDARLRLRSEACLAAQSLPEACGGCAGACPQACLEVGIDGPRLKGDCLGCGRCAAACPTGALQVEGFQEAPRLPRGNHAYPIECWKVPAAVSGSDALRVPCLGGIGLEQLLEWVEAAAEATVVLVDRGWCAHCSAARGADPIQDLLARAAAVLGECGWPASRQPQRAHEPLPPRLMPSDIPQPVEEARAHPRWHPARSRAGARQAGAEDLVDFGANDSLLYKRERLLAVATRLAARHGRPAPASLYPSLRISDNCRGVGACAAFCPTGALSPYAEEGWSGVEFDAAACLECGLCRQACRESALEFVARSEPAEGWQRLTRFPLRECAECGKRFAALGEQSACSGCRLQQRRGLDLPVRPSMPIEGSSGRADGA